MKVAFIGGGSHRLLCILRGAMGAPEIFNGGEIRLYDLNPDSAKTVAAMLRKTPEYAKISCTISVPETLNQAIDGVDVVCAIFMAGSQESHAKSIMACLDHGFTGSDNISPSGSILGVKTGGIILDLARKMEQLCPKAILLNFCNPTAVLSGLVNNHTRIRTLGVCEGVNNHRWDLNRVLGNDGLSLDFDIDAAGINHLCFVMRGTYKDKDIFQTINRAIAGNWKSPRIKGDPGRKKFMVNALKRSVRIYQELGVMLYSGENDGTAHLCYDEIYRESKQREIDAGAKTNAQRLRFHSRFTPRKRREMHQSFIKWLDKELDDKFWENYPEKDSRFGRDDHSVFLQALRGFAKIEKVKMTSSRPNSGAICGIGDRNVTEYSHLIYGDKIVPAGKYRIPDVVHGVINSLAVHQTMLGDAIAENNPQLLARAFLAYPVQQYSPRARKLYKRLGKINQAEIPKELHNFTKYL